MLTAMILYLNKDLYVKFYSLCVATFSNNKLYCVYATHTRESHTYTRIDVISDFIQICSIHEVTCSWYNGIVMSFTVHVYNMICLWGFTQGVSRPIYFYTITCILNKIYGRQWKDMIRQIRFNLILKNILNL